MQEHIVIGVDTGGTFTDLVLYDRQSRNLLSWKLLSTPDEPGRAVLEGVTALLEEYEQVCGARPELQNILVVHGSTVATNALLERKTGRCAFITTSGFEDLPWIGRQNRPELYALHVEKPRPHLQRELVHGVVERMLCDGTALTVLSTAEIERAVSFLRQSAVRSAAICLLHSYANPEHESRLAAAIRSALPELHLTVSSELLPEFREFERGATCIANAAVAPRMQDYIGNLERELRPARLRIMASSGGSQLPQEIYARPVETVLSGPAGGLLGAWESAREAGSERVIAFDMGGTSTDVSLIDASLPSTARGSLAGWPLRLPMADIHSVGAGGGSIAWLDSGAALRIGPRSMGADPGPACYGRQGPQLTPTVTDAHVVLGTLPVTASLGASLTLDPELARRAISPLAQQLGMALEEAALGILRVAESQMAHALRRISVERGHDPRDFSLLCFGGAGGLHAAALAAELGIRRIIVPQRGGLLSAMGMLYSRPLYNFSRSLIIGIEHGQRQQHDILRHPVVEEARRDLLRLADERMRAEGLDEAERSYVFSLDLRYRGQSHELTVPFDEQVLEHFAAQHKRLYGYVMPERALELVTLRLCASGKNRPPVEQSVLKERMGPLPESSFVGLRVFNERGLQQARLIERSQLCWQDQLSGPLIVTEYGSTTLVPEGWSLSVLQQGQLVLEPDAPSGESGQRLALDTRSHDEPVELEIFRHLFASIAEEMGARLLRSAFSPNIKERGDFSCALFNASGEMIAQAAHIPVHLGSMPLSVQAILEAFPVAEMQPGERFVVNDPFAGGTHLPDITVVAPCFVRDMELPSFFVANRAHHSDVGGATPGSLPIAESIDEEGLRIAPMRLDEATLQWIAGHSRTPEERVGDLKAQRAALHVGIERMGELCLKYGLNHVERMAGRLLDYSERIMRGVISALPDGSFSFIDNLDDDGFGTVDIAIACELQIKGDSLRADFSRSARQVRGPLNAVRSITSSALNYVLLCLAPPGTPANAGVMRVAELITRPGSVLDAQAPAAVVGGNVETSQRIVDAILGALALAAPELIPAASCGSMNNIAAGGRDPRSGRPFTYYETIAGGSGGGPGGPGASAVHTHMTNTLNTPVEALEHAYPLRVTKYAIRRHSGGPGRHSGGDGVVRRYAALDEVEVTLLTERRRHHPYGLQGGDTASAGMNLLIDVDGRRTVLEGKQQLRLSAGQELEIETPGGGGWGRVPEDQ